MIDPEFSLDDFVGGFNLMPNVTIESRNASIVTLQKLRGEYNPAYDRSVVLLTLTDSYTSDSVVKQMTLPEFDMFITDLLRVRVRLQEIADE